MDALCRSCFHVYAAHSDKDTCPRCASRHVLVHPELHSLSIAHMDCDAFYAAVEKRDNPELRDRPVIVGGGVRGVVTTACYIARLSGVKSAMPMFKARRACPQAVIVKPRMSHYRDVSRDIRALMLSITPQIEPISVDEAFLDMEGTQTLHKASPATVLARLAKRIEDEVGITVSIGLSHNKFLAKVASDYDKPRGFFPIGKAETLDFLSTLPVQTLWGVGKSFAGTLSRAGITHVSQLQSLSEDRLMADYGSMGRHIWRLANGLDSRPVKTERAAKSISSERTFSQDINALEPLSDLAWSLAEDVSTSLKDKDLSARTAHLKLKTTDFTLITRSNTPSRPIESARALFEAVHPLLVKETDGRDFRLLGVGVSGLQEAGDAVDALDLFTSDGEERSGKDVETLMGQIRARHGKASIVTGRGLRARTKGHDKRQSIAATQRIEDAPKKT